MASPAPIARPKSPPLDTPTTLAPLHLRLFALLFDYAIIVSGVKLTEQVLLGNGWDLRPMAATPGWATFATDSQGAMLALLLMRDSLFSMGKWLTDLSIRRADDPTRAPAWWTHIARNVSLVVLPLDVWLVFRDPKGQRLGERWTHTVLVQRPVVRDLYQRALGLGIVFLGFILGALLITSWNLRRSAAFQTAYAAAQADPALAAQVGAPVTVDRTPELELHVPDAKHGATGVATATGAAANEGSATATFDAKGMTGRAKLQVHMKLIPATATEPAHWAVEHTDLFDARGGALPQQPAPARLAPTTPQPAAK
jgi:hypothetical protein